MAQHLCRRPGCGRSVPPRVLACREDWFALPGVMRDRVLSTYVPRQEITGDVDPEYSAIIREVMEYWEMHSELPRADSA